MASLATRQNIILTSAVNAGRLQTPAIVVDPLTTTLRVRLRRPTTLAPLAWTAADTVRITLRYAIDGQIYACVGHASGGIRLNRDGSEASFYELTYQLPVVMRDGIARRLGETGIRGEASILLELLRGTLTSELLAADTTVTLAPRMLEHQSVAFDAVTSAIELAGDGELSVSHTAGGSDRAAFIGVGNSGTFPRLGSVTYGGTAATEMWDAIFGSNFAHAGYRFTNPAASAQTVTSTLDVGGVDEHVLGVISMTGVNQTTPVGAAATATGLSTTATVTVASVGADDMVVCNLYSGWSGATPGADQTERYDQITVNVSGSGDTQLGSAGGVMSKTQTAVGFSEDWGIGAVAFKPVAGFNPSTGFPWMQQPPFIPAKTEVVSYG